MTDRHTILHEIRTAAAELDKLYVRMAADTNPTPHELERCDILLRNITEAFYVWAIWPTNPPLLRNITEASPPTTTPTTTPPSKPP